MDPGEGTKMQVSTVPKDCRLKSKSGVALMVDVGRHMTVRLSNRGWSGAIAANRNKINRTKRNAR